MFAIFCNSTVTNLQNRNKVHAAIYQLTIINTSKSPNILLFRQLKAQKKSDAKHF